MDRVRDIVYKRRLAWLFRHGAQVAQLVEHVTENHGVGGSIPPLGTTYSQIAFTLNLPTFSYVSSIPGSG